MIRTTDNNKTRFNLSVFTVALVFILALSGCGGGGDETSGEATDQSSPANTSPKAVTVISGRA